VVGSLGHKQASRSHCNINQSCSALPQTETLLIRAEPSETSWCAQTASVCHGAWVTLLVGYSTVCRWQCTHGQV
jgi:hypothetical protein